MSNLATNLDSISVGQAQKEITAMALFDAMSPSALYGRRANTSGGLTWGFYGGNLLDVATQIANGTLNLPVSSTCYVQADKTTGVVSFNTTGFTSTSIQLYVVTTDTLTVSNYIDVRPSPLKSGSGSTASALQTSDEGVSLSATTTSINFTGAGVTATTVGNAITVNVPGGGSSALSIKDETVALTSATTSINFEGAGVTATTVGNEVTVTIPGGSGSGSALQTSDEGVSLSATTTAINFTGAGVTATTVGNAITVNVPGGGSGGIPVNSNVYFGAILDTLDVNNGGYSNFIYLPGNQILNMASSFKLRLNLIKASGNILIGNMTLKKTNAGSLNVISSQVVTIGGVTNPTVTSAGAGVRTVFETDTITASLSPYFDYWFIIYYSPQAGLDIYRNTSFAYGAVRGGYGSASDQTGVTSIPAVNLSVNYLVSNVISV